MNPYRILVTGARDWPADLSEFVDTTISVQVASVLGLRQRVIVVHGVCPHGGVDAIAQRHVETSPYHAAVREDGFRWLDVEQHPANWVMLGKAAGPIRNGDMVALGADICLAFPMPGSRGTVDCYTKAIRASILTHVYPVDYARRQMVSWRSE